MKNPDIYIGIFGHAKHGKSTLAGRILYELNGLSDREIELLKIEASEKGKDHNPFNLAFLKRQSITDIDPSRTSFPERGKIKLPNGKEITIIDTPGHESYIHNIVYSAYLSDIAILTVEASEDIAPGTINIFRLLNSFKIHIAAIVITKMDIVGYSELFYQKKCDQIIDRVFKNESGKIINIPIIPIDARSDQECGIKSKSKIDWYNGITLIELLDQLNKSYDLASEETRFIVEGKKEIYNVEGLGTVLVGMLETGTLNTSDKLYLQPNTEIEAKNLVFDIKSLEYSKPFNSTIDADRKSDVVKARAIISVAITNRTGLDKTEIEKILRHGGVFSNNTTHLPKKIKSIEAEISFFEPLTVYEGKEYIFYSNASHTVATFFNLFEEESSRYHLRKNSNDAVGVIEFETKIRKNIKLNFKYPICIEANPRFHRLTRFVLKENNKIVACGICTKILS